MRTSLLKIKEIEDHLLNLAPAEDALLFEAKIILDHDLREQVQLQQQTHELIRQYGRKMLKAEIGAVHQQLFNNPARHSFVFQILNLFK